MGRASFEPERFASATARPQLSRGSTERSEGEQNKKMVPPVRLERTLPKETDFESVASTNSATGAFAMKRAELASGRAANQQASALDAAPRLA